MRLEFQISTAAFIASLRRRAANVTFCQPNPMDVPGVGQVIIDRFTLLETSIAGTRVSQRMQVRVVTLAALEASSPDEAWGVEFQFSILMDLWVGPGPNGLEFRTTYAGIANETLPEAALASADAWLTENRPLERTVPLDLTLLLTALGLAPGTIPTAGLMSNPTALALRIDFSPTLDQVGWTTFMKGNFDVFLAPEKGQNIALFVDKDLLLPGIQSQVQQQLGAQLSLNAVGVKWQPQTWGARIHFDVGATAIDACPTILFGNVDVDVDIDIDIDVSLPKADTLQSHASYSWDVNNWDIATCAFGLSLSLSPAVLINPVLIVVPVLGFFAPIYFASTYTPPIPEQPQCVQGDHAVTCTQALKPPKVFGQGSIQELNGLANGLLFRGATTVPGNVALPVIASLSAHSLGFTVGGTCESLKIEGNGGGIDIEYDPEESGTICRVSLMPGSGNYAPAIWGNNQVVVSYPFGGKDTPTEPCRILLQTTGGARIVDLGVPPDLADKNVQEAMKLALDGQKKICDDLKISPPKPGSGTGPGPGPSPGPGPDPQPDPTLIGKISWFEDVFWERFGSGQDVMFHVVAGGGNPGDRFTVTRNGGADVIGSMTVPGAGGSEFGTFVTLGKDKPMLTIPAGSWASTRLFLMGSVLQRVGSIRTPFAPTDVRFGFAAGELVATISDHIQSQTFSLQQPRFPLFLRAGGPTESVLPIESGKDRRAVPARMQTRRNAFFVARPDGGGDVLDMSDKRPRVLASYTQRPWFVASDRKGRFVAHSRRNETIIYRIVAVHREEISPGASEIQRPRPPVDRPK